MFGFSAEHILILAAILLIFGPKRLPQMGATIGKTMRNFKEQMNGIIEPEYRKLGESIVQPVRQPEAKATSAKAEATAQAPGQPQNPETVNPC